MVRLGNIYTKLVAEGCVLFSDWQVKLLCDKRCVACALINFGSGTEILKGRQDGEKDVIDIIQQLAAFMEHCHARWRDYIDQKRDKYYSLNHYTIDQMVILQQELVKIGTEKELSPFIFPLLEAVKKDCSIVDIREAITAVRLEVFGGGEEDNDEVREEEEVTHDLDSEPMDEPEDTSIAQFIKEMETAGYTQALALKALEHCQPEDIDAGMIMSLLNLTFIFISHLVSSIMN